MRTGKPVRSSFLALSTSQDIQNHQVKNFLPQYSFTKFKIVSWEKTNEGSPLFPCSVHLHQKILDSLSPPTPSPRCAPSPRFSQECELPQHSPSWGQASYLKLSALTAAKLESSCKFSLFTGSKGLSIICLASRH